MASRVRPARASRTSAPLIDSTSVSRRAPRRPRASRGDARSPVSCACTFISQGSSCSPIPVPAATALPSFIIARTSRPRSVYSSSAAKWKSCGSSVRAATPLTVALKISFDHCAGRRSENASAFRPDDSMSRDTSSTSSSGVSSYGPSQVGVSSTYSTSVSECRVPLMKVIAEMSGHGPYRRTISSAPRPFWTVISVASGKCPSIADATASRSVPLHAMIPRSKAGRPAGSTLASTCASRSLRPVMRKPRSFSASACSRRRVKTETSATCARCPAKRLPIVPAPITQTRALIWQAPLWHRDHARIAEVGTPCRA